MARALQPHPSGTASVPLPVPPSLHHVRGSYTQLTVQTRCGLQGHPVCTGVLSSPPHADRVVTRGCWWRSTRETPPLRTPCLLQRPWGEEPLPSVLESWSCDTDCVQKQDPPALQLTMAKQASFHLMAWLSQAQGSLCPP